MWRAAGLVLVVGCGTAMAAPALAADVLGSDVLALTSAAAAPELTPLPSALLTANSPAAAHDWRSNAAPLSARSALQVSVADAPHPGGRLMLPPGMKPGEAVYAVTLRRDWPGALRFETGPLGVDLSPHAGVGMTSAGGMAEAGATLQVSERRDKMAVDRLKALGVRDGEAFGDKGRWYLFAAASGRAVGMNMLHGEGGWDRAGWTTDPTSSLVGDAQIGVGWRKGAMQSSVGLIHREIKAQHLLYGVETKDDSILAFSFTVKPRR
jgi:hypothetical protein